MNRSVFFVIFILFTVLHIVVIKATNFPVNKPVSSEKQIDRHNATKKENTTSEDATTDPDTLDGGDLQSNSDTANDLPFNSPRFVQSKADEGEIQQTKEALRIKEAHELRRDETMVKAERKREIASLLRKAAERAKGAKSELGASADQEKENASLQGNPELTIEKFQEIANLRRARVLEFEANLLDARAQKYDKLAKSAKLDAIGFPICSMLKVGPLEFVTTLDEIRHRIDHTVMGRLDGKTLTIMKAKRPKLTYELRSMQLPIFNLADSGENCFGFSYHGIDQVLCTVNELSRNSWMDALSEAWFCHNEGLQGTLPSIKATEEEMLTKAKVEKPTPAPKIEKAEPEPLVDINIGVDSEGNRKFTVNGKDLGPKVK